MSSDLTTGVGPADQIAREERPENIERVHQGLTDLQYVWVALVLAAFTAVEVSISYIDIGPIFLPLLLVLMVLKFFAVVTLFMHLKFDNKLFSVMFYLGLGLAISVYVGALATFHFFSS